LSFEIAVRCAADGFLNFAESPCRRLSKCTAFKKGKNRKSKIENQKKEILEIFACILYAENSEAKLLDVELQKSKKYFIKFRTFKNNCVLAMA